MLVAVVLLMAAVSAGAAPAPTAGSAPRLELPIEGVATNPDWIAKPSGEDVSRFYPTLAREMGIPGRALVNCRVSMLGALQDCKVAGEAPVGLGFGKAVLAMAPLFQMRPQTVNGVAVGGAEVNIPIRFAPRARTRVQPPPPRFATPTQRSLSLARRLAVAVSGPTMALAKNQVDATKAFSEIENPPSTDAEVATRAAALDARDQAYEAASVKLIDASTVTYAATFSEDELMQIVAFAEGKSGQAWFLREGETQFAQAAARQGIWGDILQDAVARFCRASACPLPPPSELAK